MKIILYTVGDPLSNIKIFFLWLTSTYKVIWKENLALNHRSSKRQLLVWWSICIVNSIDITKFLCTTPPRTIPFIPDTCSFARIGWPKWPVCRKLHCTMEPCQTTAHLISRWKERKIWPPNQKVWLPLFFRLALHESKIFLLLTW